MKNQTGKRIKKEVFVYEKGIDLYTTLGELTECEVKSGGLSINWKETEHMRLIMATLIKQAKKELAPAGITNLDTLYSLNYKIKGIFREIVNQFDFNRPFYGLNGEFHKAVIFIHYRLLVEVVSHKDGRELVTQDKEAFRFK